MKKTIYTCDGPECSKTTGDADEWLSINSSDSSLSIENGLPKRRLREMNNGGSIHFCSKECLQNLLVHPEAPSIEMTGADLIAFERKEQLSKHGYSLKADLRYTNEELIFASLYTITMDARYYPSTWNNGFKNKILGKDLTERLIVAGALIAAEIDRIRSI